MTNTQYAVYVATIVALTAIGCAPVDEEPEPQPSIDGGVVVTNAGSDAQAADASIDKMNGSTAAPTMFPQAGDFAVLPLAIKIVPVNYAGWRTSSSLWAYSIWDRNGVVGGGGRKGNWYRGGQVNWSLFVNNVWPDNDYTCRVEFLGAVCIHRPTNTQRWFGCPVDLQVAQNPSEWRSFYNSTAPNHGWFLWDWYTAVRWASFADRLRYPLNEVVLTASGRQVNCVYKGGQDTDVWIEWRAPAYAQ